MFLLSPCLAGLVMRWISGAVEHLFIRGREMPRESRQTELLERYKTLPPKY